MFVYKMYPIFRQTFVYILHTKCIQNVCIQNVSHIPDKLLYTFCTQNLADIASSFHFVYKMHTKACQNVVYILYTFCLHQLYTSCTIFVYKMYTQFPCGNHMMYGS